MTKYEIGPQIVSPSRLMDIASQKNPPPVYDSMMNVFLDSVKMTSRPFSEVMNMLKQFRLKEARNYETIQRSKSK